MVDVVAGKHCSYSLAKPKWEQLESFVWNTGVHVIVASSVNGLALYFMGVEKRAPHLFIGTAAAFAVNITHKISHTVGKENKNGCHMPFGIDFAYVAFLTYCFARGLLSAFGYEIVNRDIAIGGGVAVISLTAFNKLRNDYEEEIKHD